ncbi:hypothetical protein Bca4012_047614 [Brassica carinata]|uniref:Uncharacterized protein n=3 Tax=Brassica TaxID=3705 RepID=A0A0D3AIB7_BRAOL|nr:unnamed protein product [Brassica napus]CDY64846.1 BnaCnng45340D [Brassica napus]VDD18727.1 unnamed protein product [Brassica oleracea]
MEKMLPQSDLHLPHFINHAQIFTHIHLKPHHGLFTLPQPNLLEPQQLLIRRSVYKRRLREQKHRVAPLSVSGVPYFHVDFDGGVLAVGSHRVQ